MQAHHDAAELYAQLGYDPIPLRANSKRPVAARWQMVPAVAQWQHAPPDANIGIRCGGALQLAVIDADDKHDAETSARITRYLAALGLAAGDYPHVSTPSGGAHFYLALDAALDGNYHPLARELGRGEVRHGHGAQVAAPPSILENRAYELAAGDYRQLPRVERGDLLPLLGAPIAASSTPTPRVSRRCWRLLRGEGIERYATRSEAEQAIIASLVNTGHDFASVLSLFTRYPCAGKFAELHKRNPPRATKWLQHSFDSARKWTAQHESNARQLARAARAWAESRAWTGRTASVDRAVYIAHCIIAERAAQMRYAASCREVAELASIGSKTATRATHRLKECELLALEKPAAASLSNVYSLRAQRVRSDTLTNHVTVRECVTTHSHDAFRARHGLGKSAAEIYSLLQAEPLTVAELAARSGRHITTIRRALARMSHILDARTGEVLSLVEYDGEKWRALDVNLDEIARALGTLGAAEQQKRKHAQERAAHRAALAVKR